MKQCRPLYNTGTMPMLQKTMTPQDLAEACLDEADGDWKQAAELMEHRIHHDITLRQTLIEPLILEAIWKAIRHAAHKQRRVYRADGVTPGEDDPEGIRQSVRRSWYDYPIFGGKKLGDATADDLIEAENRYRQLANSNQAEAERMLKIWSSLGNVSPVREQLTEDEIAELMA